MKVEIKAPKKLIEVALPLDDINAAATREKSIRHGHPSTLHLWWARRPLAAARAVLFAQLVNDPGYERNLNRGVNKKAAQAERERLFGLIRELVKWENTTNEEVLGKARAEIWKSWRETCGLNKNHPRAKELFDPDKLPAFHDPFAGGGAIPLEAQRLGLEAWASDLNPVAVLINKAMIEIPPKFSGRPPVNPASREDKNWFEREWKGAQGLAEDVRYYGQWMRDEAGKRIGHLYPKVEVTAAMAEERPDLKKYVGCKLTVIAWLWARTVKSPNPAFAEVEVPLVSTFMLSTKPGKEAYVEPVIEGNGYHFTVKVGKPQDFEAAKKGTKVSRGNFRCLMSDVPIKYAYIDDEANAGRMGARLMAIVAEGDRKRVYLAPTLEHEVTPCKAKPKWKSDLPSRGTWASNAQGRYYGFHTFGDYFTPRQLVALTTFSDLVGEAMVRVKQDYLGARASRPHKTWHSRGYLPHWEAGKAPQSITFRLHDSLSSELLERWREELSRLPESEQALERRKRFEAVLDAGHGTCRLRDPRIAEIVEHALLHFDGERYRLHAWCVMPNHVHVLVTPLHGNSLSSILHSWKSFTAKEANRLLVRTGAFWQEEYFDRVIRDDTHFVRVVAYIENNPVKAGLCERTEVWRFGSAWERKEERAGRPRSQDDVPLAEGGTGATAYAEAVGVYLAFALSKQADLGNSLCRWEPIAQCPRQLFGRQAIPMIWDYAEGNPLGSSSGAWTVFVDGIVKAFTKAFEFIPKDARGRAQQTDAALQDISRGRVVSTDPPYYDNIGYADLSDFFYVWLRRSLKPVFPELFATLAVPKAEELVATPYRHGSKEKAETFFLDGMTQAMHRLAEQAHPAFPITIYYAFKQSETKGDGGTTSTGWVTFLGAVTQAGFSIDGTWPMRTENSSRMIGQGTNALASSIILVCRKRAANAATVSRRDFLRELREALPEALEEMTGGAAESSPIAPVDLAQAAIGPGIAIFSRYAAVLNADGSTMSVHEALIEINRQIDGFQHGKVGTLDADSQFCVDWFESARWKEGRFGEADVLARAKGTSVEGVEAAGVIESRAGKVRLYKPDEYPADWGPETDARIPTWEALHQLVRALRAGGETEAGELLAHMPERSESIRQLAYRLYTLCEHKSWAEDARAYNELITAWPGIEATGSAAGPAGTQVELEI